MLPDGTVTMEHPSPAIPVAVLKEIMEWKAQGATNADVVDRLRPRTVPPGYSVHPWTAGQQ